MTVVPVYAGLCGILLLILSVQVIHLRRRHWVGIGDGDLPTLRRAMRVQANFVEYAPITLLLLALDQTAINRNRLIADNLI